MGAIILSGSINLTEAKKTGKLVKKTNKDKEEEVWLYFASWCDDKKKEWTQEDGSIKLGDNGGIYVNQTKEDREAKVDKEFIGNMSVVFHAKRDSAFDPDKASNKEVVVSTNTDDDW